MRRTVICGYVRTPFTPAFKGSFKAIRPDDLLAHAITGLVKSTSISPEDIEDIKVGTAFPEGEQGLNIARMVSFLCDLPLSVTGATTNRFCGSSMQTIHDAAGAIACGAGDVFIAAGIESMSRIPMAGLNPAPNPALYERYPEAYESMGVTAENVATKFSISRQAQEAFAVSSHKKAVFAQNNGHFDSEIISVESVNSDECIRADSSEDNLSKLSPAFDRNGTVTAGTSSPLTDGATAVLVCSEDYADAHNLPKLARIVSFATSGCAPELMGMGPVGATKKALTRANLTVDDIDIVELNEAFAAQALACMAELSLDPQKVNLDGGALALGHPLGATGARIVGKAASLLTREHKRYALATQCIGGGQGIATILEAAS